MSRSSNSDVAFLRMLAQSVAFTNWAGGIDLYPNPIMARKPGDILADYTAAVGFKGDDLDFMDHVRERLGLDEDRGTAPLTRRLEDGRRLDVA